MPAFLIGTGRLLGASLACGLNLYATIALLGIASRFDWIQLPPSLVGLEQWILIGGAAALMLAEVVASAIPYIDTTWEAVHTLIRPVAAMSLAFFALESLPWPVQVLGALVAAVAALASHSAKVGLRLILTTSRPLRLLFSAAEDLAAVTLAILALALPAVALVVVIVSLGLLAWVGPGLWRATAFAARAIVSRLRGFFDGRGWREPQELPAALRQLLRAPEEGLPLPRAARAALTSRATGLYRNGWLVVDRGSACFLFRSPLRPHRHRLSRPEDATIHHGLLADVIEMQTGDVSATLHLLKDGPSAEIALGALQLVIE